MAQLSERRNLMAQQQLPSQDIHLEKSIHKEWTDEEHSSYLNSMEAMFVKQLYNYEYNATDSLGWRSRRKNQLSPGSSEHINNAKVYTSGQVLQSGCWNKINFVGAEHGLDSTEEAHMFVASPRKPHFRSIEKSQEGTSANLSKYDTLCKGAINTGRHPRNLNKYPNDPCEKTVFSCEEVSDQNFVDEDKEPEQTSFLTMKKRKIMVANAISKDQVVPIAKSPVTVNLNESYQEKECSHPMTQTETMAGIMPSPPFSKIKTQRRTISN